MFSHGVRRSQKELILALFIVVIKELKAKTFIGVLMEKIKD